MRVRAPIVDMSQSPGIRDDAAGACRPRCAPGSWRVVVALSVFLAFGACASMRQVAQARAAGLSIRADLAERQGDEPELGRALPEASHVRQNSVALPMCEHEVVAPDDTAHDAGLGAPGAGPHVFYAPTPAGVRQPASTVCLPWVKQVWDSSLLARGPPCSLARG